jgi:hypothetical protein
MNKYLMEKSIVQILIMAKIKMGKIFMAKLTMV